MADHRKQSNILLCGSPRVGKSTLINAICQQKLAKSSSSLNSVTEKVDRYSFEYSNGKTTHETVIWDTPGIESWNENEVRNYMASLIERTQPLCMIYCASPGSFAVLNQVAWLVSECYRQKIFCALVCTNMWSGRNRQQVVDEFCRLLNLVHPTILAEKEDNVIYYDRVALVTMVNSEEYIDNDFGVQKPPSGVEELIFGIAKCLKRDLMFAWFRSVAQNKSFWSKMSTKLNELLRVPNDTFTAFCEHATTFLQLLFDPSDFSAESYFPTANDNTSFTATDTENYLFQDAEMVPRPGQMYQKKLEFTFKSEDAKVIATLNQTLSKFGAKSCKTEELLIENEQLFTVTAEFGNVEDLEAVHSFWQLATANKAQCIIVTEHYTNFQS